MMLHSAMFALLWLLAGCVAALAFGAFARAGGGQR